MSIAADQRVVRLADEVGENGLIEGRVYEDCVIQGPAMIVPLEDVTFDSNTWVIDPNGLFVEFPEGSSIQGAIGLGGVTIRRCELRNIAVAGTPDVIARIRPQFQFPEAVAVQASPAVLR
jgi:hypothetical protein